MKELLPITLGLGLGAVVGLARPSISIAYAAVLAILLGVLATVVTGEFKTSWGYLLVDIPLVALAAVAALVMVRRLRPAEERA